MEKAKTKEEIFISYSHDSVDHVKRVLELSNKLRNDGINCEIDQYTDSPPEGWPRWMEKKIVNAKKVLMICTKKYYERVMGVEKEGDGLGVRWEGNLIYQELYNSGSKNTKFIPIIFSDEDICYIPGPVQGGTFYCIKTDDGYKDLYWRLRDVPKAEKPILGKLKSLPKKVVKTDPVLYLTGPIQVDLWDNAKWLGLYFEIYDDHPPLLGIIFENAEYAVRIFTDWQNRYGRKDNFEELRLSIIEGDIPGEDPGYSIHICTDPEGFRRRLESQGYEINSNLIAMISRVHRMNPPKTSMNLQKFKLALIKYKTYFLVPCLLKADGKNIQPIFELGIYKEKISFRKVIDINNIDIDYVVFNGYA